jgi:lysophospholipid acyltransferase (LPLAT)-like uncharacterized protein
MPGEASSSTRGEAQPTPAKSSGVVIPCAPTWRQRMGARLVYILICSVAATLRYKWTDRSGFYDHPPAKAAIITIWHNRLALVLQAYFSYVKKRNQTPGLVAMISASRDGGFLEGVFDCFGVRTARGSSSRRGSQALRELTTLAKQGYDLGITPDGPRGPCYVAQDGVIFLAQLTGLPIMPLSYQLSWKIRMKSWDRFQIPLPFSRCEIFFEKPIYVPREASPEEREALRKKLEEVLRSISPD